MANSGCNEFTSPVMLSHNSNRNNNNVNMINFLIVVII